MTDTVADPGSRTPMRTVTVRGHTYVLAEGDLLIEKEELAEFLAAREAAATRIEGKLFGSTGDRSELASDPGLSYLLGIEEDGKIVRWRPGLHLTYRVARDTFPDVDRYQQVRNEIAEAMEAWQAACLVEFEHLPKLDAGDSSDGALFEVVYHDAKGEFVAAAFFPNTKPDQRWVLIDPTYFGANQSFDRVGVLRHELGHVLGFRHEHIRPGAPAICPDEDPTGTFDLTDYDPQSVMHYLCGGVGSPQLQLTTLDRRAASSLYGPPLQILKLYE